MSTFKVVYFKGVYKLIDGRWGNYEVAQHLYWTQVRSLSTLVSNWLTPV